jgi:hypothetical protein
LFYLFILFFGSSCAWAKGQWSLERRPLLPTSSPTVLVYNNNNNNDNNNDNNNNNNNNDNNDNNDDNNKNKNKINSWAKGQMVAGKAADTADVLPHSLGI